jgi:hypothetical protein
VSEHCISIPDSKGFHRRRSGIADVTILVERA